MKLDIIEAGRVYHNRCVKSHSNALNYWFGRPKTKDQTKMLPERISYATIDHDDEVGKLIAEYVHGRKEEDIQPLQDAGNE